MTLRVVVSLTIVAIGSVLGANVYNSVVDAPNWGAAIPSSVEVMRRYYAVADPGTFYRALSPVAQLLALTSLVLCWRRGASVRRLAGVGFALTVAADVLTFAYFYPRNTILMGNAADATALTAAWLEWSRMNHLRSTLVLGAMASELAVLTRLSEARPTH